MGIVKVLEQENKDLKLELDNIYLSKKVNESDQNILQNQIKFLKDKLQEI